MAVAPYDVIQTVCNSARVKLNDAIQALAGEVLTDNAVFTTQFVNNAWRRLQRGLAARGYLTLEDQAIILAIPAAGSADPGQESWINWAGCFDGVNSFATPVLPQNFISPLRLWGRQNGTTDSFEDMDMVLRGLPSVPKKDWNELWEWREDAIFYNGANVATDLRVRYAAYFGDFASVTDGTQVVPIMQCLDPFSNLICSEVSGSRGDVDAASFDEKAEAGMDAIAARDLQGPRSMLKSSEAGKQLDRLTPKH